MQLHTFIKVVLLKKNLC